MRFPAFLCLLAFAFAVFAAGAYAADGHYGTGKNLDRIFVGESGGEVCSVYSGEGHAPVWTRGSTAQHPAVSDFGASDGGGAGKQTTLTILAASLPTSPTVSGTLAHTTSYDLLRAAGGAATTVAASPSPSTSVLYTEHLTPTFHPDSRGWRYTVAAHNAAIDPCGVAHASATIRVVTPPTITALTASPPAVAQVPGAFIICSSVNWTATAGDPAATWAFGQGGHSVSHLPSAKNSAPGRGPQRICVTRAAGDTTTLTLTGANEAGSASRSVIIQWPSGQ